MIFEEKCIGCGECYKQCTTGAMTWNGTGRLYDRGKCRLCGACVSRCYAETLVMEGKEATVGEILAEVEKDRPFYENSGGGITLSGGEPTAQQEFCLALLRESKRRNLHTVLDTSGYCAWSVLEQLLPYVDMVLYDIKHADESEHQALTGVSNRVILENLLKLAEAGVPVDIRMVVVPGLTDSAENIRAMAELAKRVATLRCVTLLPYHRLAEGKYVRLGREYRLQGLEPPPEEELNRIAGRLSSEGLAVNLHG